MWGIPITLDFATVASLYLKGQDQIDKNKKDKKNNQISDSETNQDQKVDSKKDTKINTIYNPMIKKD